jgi:hypothetical protein
MSFSDGIDAFFVIQTPGQFDPLKGAPSSHRAAGGQAPHTIVFFDDPSMRVYLFHHGGRNVTVAGRGSLSRLAQVSRSIYRQAIGR